jgi:hypothetical protein
VVEVEGTYTLSLTFSSDYLDIYVLWRAILLHDRNGFNTRLGGDMLGRKLGGGEVEERSSALCVVPYLLVYKPPFAISPLAYSPPPSKGSST